MHKIFVYGPVRNNGFTFLVGMLLLMCGIAFLFTDVPNPLTPTYWAIAAVGVACLLFLLVQAYREWKLQYGTAFYPDRIAVRNKAGEFTILAQDIRKVKGTDDFVRILYLYNGTEETLRLFVLSPEKVQIALEWLYECAHPEETEEEDKENASESEPLQDPGPFVNRPPLWSFILFLVGVVLSCTGFLVAWFGFSARLNSDSLFTISMICTLFFVLCCLGLWSCARETVTWDGITISFGRMIGNPRKIRLADANFYFFTNAGNLVRMEFLDALGHTLLLVKVEPYLLKDNLFFVLNVHLKELSPPEYAALKQKES